jgi:hypothetical protein
LKVKTAQILVNLVNHIWGNYLLVLDNLACQIISLVALEFWFILACAWGFGVTSAVKRIHFGQKWEDDRHLFLYPTLVCQ